MVGAIGTRRKFANKWQRKWRVYTIHRIDKRLLTTRHAPNYSLLRGKLGPSNPCGVPKPRTRIHPNQSVYCVAEMGIHITAVKSIPLGKLFQGIRDASPHCTNTAQANFEQYRKPGSALPCLTDAKVIPWPNLPQQWQTKVCPPFSTSLPSQCTKQHQNLEWKGCLTTELKVASTMRFTEQLVL